MFGLTEAIQPPDMASHPAGQFHLHTPDRGKKVQANDTGRATNEAIAVPPDLGPERTASVKDWLVLLLLMTALICSYIDRFAFALLLEPIKSALGASDAALGLLNGVAFGLFFATMGLPLGRLADRWSRKGTIIIGISVWTAATALCGLAGNFLHLLVARIGVGAGEAGLTPASYSLVHDRFPRARLGVALSIYQLGSMVGAGTAFIVAGAAYQYFQAGHGASWPWIGALAPWQKTFIAVALPGLPLIALLTLMREPGKRPRAATQMVHPSTPRGNLLHFIVTFLGASGGTLAIYGLTLWLPAVLAREYGWSPGQAGATYGMIVMIVGPAGLLSGGWISDFITRRRGHGAHIAIVFASIVSALPLMAAIGLTSNSTLLLILVAISHYLLALPAGVLPAYIQIETAPESRSQMSALYVFIINIVAIGIGPSLIGFISSLAPGDPTALRTAITAVSVPFLAGSAVILFFMLRGSKRRDRSHIGRTPQHR